MRSIPIAADAGTITKPNFLIIGAAKSGTTAAWHSLGRHPEIYMSPRKHTRFFAYNAEEPAFRGPALPAESFPYSIKDPNAYRELFEGVTHEKAVGEASHSYLYRPEAAGRIARYEPRMKLIAILRNPAERAFSHYNQMVRDGREASPDFLRALEAEDDRVKDRWWPDFHYVRIGLYHDQLKRYLDLFPRDQLRVYLYEDFSTDPLKILQDMFRFLGVDDAWVPPTSLRYNASGIPKNKFANALLKKARSFRPAVERLLPEQQAGRLLRAGSILHNRNLTRPTLEPRVRERVTDEYFREDIHKLESLLQRNLSVWFPS